MDTGYRISVITLFPELVQRYFETSILGKAVESGSIVPVLVNPRDYATDKHRTCDDAPYGGGAGMVLLPAPLSQALEAVDARSRHVVFPTPSGRRFTQNDADRLSKNEGVVLVCGRYEGIDQRIVDEYVDEEFSIGDYVLSSGELAAMVVIDAIYRLREGMIKRESVENDSFQDGLVEHPHYTRPKTWHGRRVPGVLLSGRHRKVEEWRRWEKIRRTAIARPDLLERAELTKEERRYVERVVNIQGEHNGRDKEC